MPFSGFSEATRTYVEDLPRIEALRKCFHGDLDAYFEDLRCELERQELRADLREFSTFDREGDFHYWWLSTGGKPPTDRPRLWVFPHAASIVETGSAWFTAALPRSTEARRLELQGIAGDLEVAAYCRPAKGTEWSLFEICVPCTPEEIPEAARRLAHVLNRMKDLELRWQSEVECGRCPT